ncbi:actin cortical patch SUR7/pH-response regulator pali [Mariannaea sp. PMI_226]|nr:actin cortical patch SUR7/pH-response regulator pali [Mariannaea sp. PMI_226]
MLSRLTIVIPLVLSMVAFVLSNLTLFAGREKGFMEEYSIVRLNTSMIGHDLLKTDTKDDSSNDDDNDDDGLLGWAKDKFDDIKDDVKDEIKQAINNITGEVADHWASALGIKEWYSLHVIDLCEGNYKPNATASGAGFNVSKCTKNSVHDYNVSKLLEQDLSIGPFNFTLAELGWSDDINDAIAKLNDALHGLFIVYVICIVASGLSIIACVVALIWFKEHASTTKAVKTNFRCASANIVIASLAAGSIFAASMIVTIAADKGVKKLNSSADAIGVSASLGHKFLALTWAAFAFMMSATIYWVSHRCFAQRRHKREWTLRKGSSDAATRDGSYEMSQRR